MELKTNSTAGTMESSDIMIMLEPRTEGGIELELTSSVMQQFGNRYAKLFLTRFRNTMFKMQKWRQWIKVRWIAPFAPAPLPQFTVRLSAAITAGKFKRIYPWEEGCFCGTEYRNI